MEINLLFGNKIGADGDTPYIGSNGNWWIGDKDTSVSASSPAAILSAVLITDWNNIPDSALPAPGQSKTVRCNSAANSPEGMTDAFGFINSPWDKAYICVMYPFLEKSNVYKRTYSQGKWREWTTTVNSNGDQTINGNKTFNDNLIFNKTLISARTSSGAVLQDNAGITYLGLSGATTYVGRKTGQTIVESSNTDIIHTRTSSTTVNARVWDSVNLPTEHGYIMKYFEINTLSLDQNTWYPVTIQLGRTYNTRIEVLNPFEYGAPIPSWATHAEGFSARTIWEVNGDGWSSNPLNRTILQSSYKWAAMNPVRGIGQMTFSSNEYVFVRGGAKYHFYISHNAIPILRTQAYTENGQTVEPTTTAPPVIETTLSKYVDKSSTETIGGAKTFGSIPVLPATDPTSPNHATRKGYVDNAIKFKTQQINVSTYTATIDSLVDNTVYTFSGPINVLRITGTTAGWDNLSTAILCIQWANLGSPSISFGTTGITAFDQTAPYGNRYSELTIFNNKAKLNVGG